MSKAIIHNFEQRSPEWYAIRLGKFTGSDFHTFLGKSATKDRLILEKASEHITGKPTNEDNFISTDMQRGIDNEDYARQLYEAETFNKVEQIGFAELDEFTGCSPDGLVGDDGIIEIKCPKQSVFIDQVIKNKIKPEYETQIQFNLMVLDRKWCDYIAYNINFPLRVVRIFRDEDKIGAIRSALADVISQAKGIISDFKKATSGVENSDTVQTPAEEKKEETPKKRTRKAKAE